MPEAGSMRGCALKPCPRPSMRSMASKPVLTWSGSGSGLGLGLGLGVDSLEARAHHEAALEQAAVQVVATLAVHRARDDALRHARLPQREDLAAQSDHVRVGHVLERQPAGVGQHTTALRLRTKGVALEDGIRRLLLLEVRRAHEAALEARPARRAVDRDAAEVPVAVEKMLEAPPTSLEVARPIAPHRLPLRSAGMVPSISPISYSYSPATDGGTAIADGVSTAVGEVRRPPRACRPTRCGGAKVAQVVWLISHRQSMWAGKVGCRTFCCSALFAKKLQLSPPRDQSCWRGESNKLAGEEKRCKIEPTHGNLLPLGPAHRLRPEGIRPDRLGCGRGGACCAAASLASAAPRRAAGCWRHGRPKTLAPPANLSSSRALARARRRWACAWS
eukprot:scaffold14242_cov55-Phaeocystis_antarctica.AAC.2